MGGTQKHYTDAGRVKVAVFSETSSTASETNPEFVLETVTITSNTSGTATASVITDARVGTGRQFFLGGVSAVIGGTSWAAAKNLTVQDTGANAIIATNAAGTNALTSGAVLSLGYSGVANINLVPVAAFQSGATSGQGISIASNATATTASASVTVWGYIK